MVDSLFLSSASAIYINGGQPAARGPHVAGPSGFYVWPIKILFIATHMQCCGLFHRFMSIFFLPALLECHAHEVRWMLISHNSDRQSHVVTLHSIKELLQFSQHMSQILGMQAQLG